MDIESAPMSKWRELPERRRATRVPLTVAVLKSTGQEICLCQSVDISPTGMSLRRAKGLPMSSNDPVFLRFSLPDSDEVHRITAMVVRDDSDGRCWASAVLFGPLPDRLKRKIDSYVTGTSPAN
jgi:c-di-GMP-binding flagellar brake protein YcgR